MSALVIGGTSMLGTAILTELRRLGVETFTAGRGKNCDLILDLQKQRIEKNLTVTKIDYIFHCAASFGDDSVEGRQENWETNCLSASLIVEIAETLAVKKVIYAGSIFSYIENPACFHTSYGESKAEGEKRLLSGLEQLNISFVSLRLPQLYDFLGRCCLHQPWFGRIIAYALSGDFLRLPKATALQNFLYVGDAARVMVRAAMEKFSGIHPASHPQSITYYEIAKLASSIFGNGCSIEIDEKKKAFKNIYIPQSMKTYLALNITPEYSVEEGIKKIKSLGSADKFGPMDVI